MSEALSIFLAHAIALELEAGDRYDELADVMDVHNNQDVAHLFRQMSDFSRKHAASVVERAKPHQPLPKLKSWEYRWNTPEPPEVGDFTGAHYLMTPYHALQFALANEKRGHDFYRSQAETSQDAQVRVMAAEFAGEEAEHVAELQDWISKCPQPEDGWDHDPDPAAVID